MKFDYFSDLHINRRIRMDAPVSSIRIESHMLLLNLIPPVAERGEVCIVAGDVAEDILLIDIVIEYLSKNYEHVFYVLGAHERYLIGDLQVGYYRADSDRKVDDIKRALSVYKNVTVLDNEVVSYKGRLIGGTTNWYLLVGAYQHDFWEKYSPDFKYVLPNTAAGNYGRHIRDSFFLKTLVDGLDVLITYLPPIHYYGESIANLPYNSNAIGVESLPKVWVAGRQHVQTEDSFRGAKVLINGLGYPRDGNELKVGQFTLED